MMDKEKIGQLEAANDGQSVLLFYDGMAGLYLAFGQSAYYTTMVTDPYMSYSEDLDMPVALLRREHVLALRQSLTKVTHEPKATYHFEMRLQVGKAGYERWARRIQEKHSQIHKN